MNKPNFQEMSQQDLHSYFLDHRNDQEAFYAYVDKLHTEGEWVEMSAVKSVEDLEMHPKLTARFRRGFRSRKR